MYCIKAVVFERPGRPGHAILECELLRPVFKVYNEDRYLTGIIIHVT